MSFVIKHVCCSRHMHVYIEFVYGCTYTFKTCTHWLRSIYVNRCALHKYVFPFTCTINLLLSKMNQCGEGLGGCFVCDVWNNKVLQLLTSSDCSHIFCFVYSGSRDTFYMAGTCLHRCGQTGNLKLPYYIGLCKCSAFCLIHSILLCFLDSRGECTTSYH